MMCDLYNVTRAGYYAWKSRKLCNRKLEDAYLLKEIKLFYEQSRETYGSPRIHQELKSKGINIGKKRVERIMLRNGIKARSVSMYKANRYLKHFFDKVPNREQEHPVIKLNQVWVGDITYLKVNNTYKYLAVVMDKYSRRIIGWSLGEKKDAALTVEALNNAVLSRKPKAGIIQSMNRARNVNDNAFMESFFHSFKLEYYHGRVFTCMSSLRRMIESYVPFYNYKRIHSPQ